MSMGMMAQTLEIMSSASSKYFLHCFIETCAAYESQNAAPSLILRQILQSRR